MSTGHAALGSMLIAGAAGVEAAAARALLGDACALAISCHGVATVLAGAACAQSQWPRDDSLPHDRMRRSEALQLAWVSASIVLALPAVGLAAIVVVALAIRARPRARHPPLREVERPWVGAAAFGVGPDPSARFGARGCGYERATDASLQGRLSRLLVLRRAQGARAVRCLRLALADPNEEVRLLAYALLEQREQALRAIIDDAHAELQRLRAPGRALASEAAERSRLLRLTQAYWELARSTLVVGEPAVAALEAALRYGQDALAIHFEGATALLLARVSLALEDVTGAQRWLGHAARVGLSAAARAPYEAEVSFRQCHAGSLAPPPGHERPSVRVVSRRVG